MVDKKRFSILCISDHRFAVDINFVREILPLPRITAVPNVDPAIMGVCNHHGHIYSVVDLRKVFFNEPGNPSTDKFVVILQKDNVSFGAMVDSLLEVEDWGSARKRKYRKTDRPDFADFMDGYLAPPDKEVIHFINVDKLIEAPIIKDYRYV